MPPRQSERGQRQGRVVAIEAPPNRTQVLPVTSDLVPAGLDRDDTASTRHTDERGSGPLEAARSLIPTQAPQDRGIRATRPGLVEEDETGSVNDDNVGLTGAHEGGGSHGIAQRDRRINVTANER